MAEEIKDASEIPESELFKFMFANLVLALTSETMFFLGKFVHPVTKKTERDLDKAKGSIEMLRMLREKTKGNLSAEESGLLERSISDLQLNYLEEMKKGPGEERTGEPANGRTGDEATGDDKGTEGETAEGRDGDEAQDEEKDGSKQ